MSRVIKITVTYDDGAYEVANIDPDGSVECEQFSSDGGLMGAGEITLSALIEGLTQELSTQS